MTSVIIDSLSSSNSDHQFRLLQSEYEQRLSKIDHYLTKLTKFSEFSGSLLISKCGHVLLAKGYGSSNYTQPEITKNTPHTMYRIGSLSKQFTSFIILKLHEQRLLDIDKDFLSKYLPHYPHSQRISLKMLLNHTSGIADYTELPQFESECVQKTYELDELIKIFSHCPMDFEPGTKFHYSNSNYILLGAIIQCISPLKTFEQLLEEFIFQPLNMTNTIYECNDRVTTTTNANKIAKGHETVIVYERNKTICNLIHCKYWNMTTAREAGGICTNVEDFQRWVETLFTSTSTLIEPHLFKQMITPSPVSRKYNDYGWFGYGYGLIVNEYGNVVEHSGQIYGFESYFKRLIKEQITIILFSNIFECQVKVFTDFIHSVLVGRAIEEKNEEGEFVFKTFKKFKNKFLR